MNGANVGADLQQVDRESVAERVRRHGFAQPTAISGEATRPLDGSLLHRLPGASSGEEPPGRPLDPPPGSQLLEQRRREHDVAVTSALAPCDMQDHPVTVDVGDLEPQCLAESQPGGVARGDDHPVLGTGHAVEKPNDLLGAQDDR